MKPGIEPLAPPPAAALAPGVAAVHVAQTKVSAWAAGRTATETATNISAESGWEKLGSLMAHSWILKGDVVVEQGGTIGPESHI